MAEKNSERLPPWGFMSSDCQPPLGNRMGYCRGIVNVNTHSQTPRTLYSSNNLYCQSPDNATTRLFQRIRLAEGRNFATPSLALDDNDIYSPRSLHQFAMCNKRPGEPLAAKVQPATKHNRHINFQITTEKSNEETVDLTGDEDAIQRPVHCTTTSTIPDVQAGRMEYVDGDWKRKELGAAPASQFVRPMPAPSAHGATVTNDRDGVHPHTDAQHNNMNIDQHISNNDDDLFKPARSAAVDALLDKVTHRKPIFEESDLSDVVSNRITTPPADVNVSQNEVEKLSNVEVDEAMTDDGLDYLFEDDAEVHVAEPPQPVSTSKSPDKKKSVAAPRDKAKKFPYKYRIVTPNPNTMNRVFRFAQTENRGKNSAKATADVKKPSSSIPPVTAGTGRSNTSNKTCLAGSQPTPSEESESGNATASHIAGQRHQSAKAKTPTFQKVMGEVGKHVASSNVRSSPALNALVPPKRAGCRKPTKNDTASATESDPDVRLAHAHEKKVVQELAKQKRKNEKLVASMRRTAALNAELEAMKTEQLKSGAPRDTSTANGKDQPTSAGDRAKRRIAEIKRRKEGDEAARQAAINAFHPEIPRRSKSFMVDSPLAGLTPKQFTEAMKEDQKKLKASEKAAEKANRDKPTPERSPVAQPPKRRKGASRKVIGNQSGPIKAFAKENRKEIVAKRNTGSKVVSKSAPVTPNQKNDPPVLTTKATSAPTAGKQVRNDNQYAVQPPTAFENLSKPVAADGAPSKPVAAAHIPSKSVASAHTPSGPVAAPVQAQPEIEPQQVIATAPAKPVEITQPTSQLTTTQVSDTTSPVQDNIDIVGEEMSEDEALEDKSSEDPITTPHPTTGGKSIAKLQELFSQQENVHQGNQEKDEGIEMNDEDTDVQVQVTKELERMQREASPITDDDRVYYMYQVKRKEYPKGESEDKFEWAVVGKLMYTSLQEANDAARKELAYTPHHILTGQIRRHTCHLDEYDMVHYRVETRDMIILVSVHRSLRMYGLADLPASKAGWLKKHVYAAFKVVIQIIRDDNGKEEDGPAEPDLLGVYTHLEQANRETADTALEAFTPASSRRIDDITNRRGKELELKELMQELAEEDKPYVEEMRLSDNEKVQFFVVKRPLIGPRNI